MSSSFKAHSGKALTGALAGSALPFRNAKRETYYLGVDGGGTKTHAVITNATYTVVGEGLSGPANPHRVGLKEAVANILDAITQALQNA